MSIRYFDSPKALEYLQPGGSITTTSSVQGYNPSPILHDYAATKAAIISLTKSFSAELALKVFVLTVLHLDRFGHHFKLSVDNHKALYLLLGKHTVRRAGQPVECAGTYVISI